MTHVPIGAGLVALTSPTALVSFAPAAGAAVVGSVFPDIDILVGEKDERGFTKYHRTLTHWPPLYVALGGLFFFAAPPFLLWFVMGCLLHLMLDSVTAAGIPLWKPFGKKEGVKLVYTGGIGEVPVQAGIFGLVVIIFYFWS